MAGRYDFKLDAGATFPLQFTWKSNGGFVPLIGYTARMQIRERDAFGPVVTELTTENGGIEIEAYTGTVRIVIPAQDTEDLKVPVCVYDVELTNEGTVTRILEGRIKISPNVTR